jgi:hypothetical protein
MKDKYKKKGTSEVTYIPKEEEEKKKSHVEETKRYGEKEGEGEGENQNMHMGMRATNKVYKDSSHYYNKQKYSKRKNH